MATLTVNPLSGNTPSPFNSSPNTTMNSSTTSASVDDQAILDEINRQKALLLSPAILYTVLTMLVGALGNPLAIYIYGFKWPHTTTRWFLLWLAVIDLLSCLITMPTEIYFLTSFYYIPNGNFCCLTRFVTYVINNSTSVIFVAIAIDRYIRICHPHRSPMSIRGAKIASVLSLIIGVGVSWPTFFLYGTKKVPIPTKMADKGYVWGSLCNIRNKMDDTPYPFAFFIYLCCGVSGCFLILSILYVLIGRVILKRKHNKEKRRAQRLEEHQALHGNQTVSADASPEDRKDAAPDLVSTSPEPDSGKTNCLSVPLPGNGCVSSGGPMRWSGRIIRPPKSTLMLFAITAVFVVSFLPFLIVMIVRQHVGSRFYPSLSAAMEVVVNIFSRSYLVNNCANPIVYGLCNTQFSNEVKKIFRVAIHRRNSSLSRNESNGSGIRTSHAVEEKQNTI